MTEVTTKENVQHSSGAQASGSSARGALQLLRNGGSARQEGALTNAGFPARGLSLRRITGAATCRQQGNGADPGAVAADGRTAAHPHTRTGAFMPRKVTIEQLKEAHGLGLTVCDTAHMLHIGRNTLSDAWKRMHLIVDATARRKRISDISNERFRELHDDGMSISKAARELEIPRETVRRRWTMMGLIMKPNAAPCFNGAAAPQGRALSDDEIMDIHMDNLVSTKGKSTVMIASRPISQGELNQLKALNSTSIESRIRAAKEPDATERVLMVAIKDESLAVRVNAVKHSSATPKVLDAAMNDSSYLTRMIAVSHPKAPLDVIALGLRDRDRSVRAAAKSAEARYAQNCSS
ncbi:MAG: hypothetical protein ACREBH_00310 [Candidatus Micrarchaeaceae archaeon]